MPPMTGRVIAGRYNLEHPIGRGAMGVVWRARDQLLDRDVAIKEVVISALIGADERRNAYQRTLREARTAARLSHRGVVTVYDVVEEDGRPWIVMELVPSQSLDQVLTAEGRLPAARAGRIGQQLLSALAAAHSAGVLHRDVKPSNVLISATRSGEGWDERAVLTDFGIAQFEGDPRLTQTGMVMGSPGFTAPERIRGGDAAPGSDLWSLGATIYAAVEGRGPFEQRGGAITTMSAIINEDAPVAPHAGRLAPLVAALLRRDPSTRPSASAAARMFAQVLPQLSAVTDEPPAAAHPATIRSAYVPQPAAAASVTPPEDPPVEKTPAPPVPEQSGTAKVGAGRADAAQASAEPADPEQQATSKKQPGAPALEEPGPLPGGRSAAADSEDADGGETGPDTDRSGVPEADDAMAGDEAELVAEAEAVAAAAAEPAQPAKPAKPGAGKPESARPRVPETVIGEPKAALRNARSASGSPRGGSAVGARAEAGETVIPEPKPAGYQPTELVVPVARTTSAPPKPAEASPAQPKPAEPTEPKPAEPTEPKPAQPKPSFTAAKPAERVVPTFSAAAPARPVTPSPDSRPSYGAGGGAGQSGAGQSGTGQSGAAQGAGYGYAGGSTTPYQPAGGYPPPSGGPAPAVGGQYGGPSQSYSDLGHQYTPGAGGGSAGRAGRGRRGPRRLVWLMVAVLVAAAIGVGAALALNDNSGGDKVASSSDSTPAIPDTPTTFKSVNALNNPVPVLPAGWHSARLAASTLGSTAGFAIGLPPGWSQKTTGLGTDFTGPNGMLLEIDLTAQDTTDMVAAAHEIEQQSVAIRKFPGYKRMNLMGVPVRNTRGAVWKFAWTPAGEPEQVADDIFFREQTSAGPQDYAVYVRSPKSAFAKTALPQFDQILQTFQTIPATQTLPPARAGSAS